MFFKMKKKEYQTPHTKLIRFVPSHSFMEWSDWADAKRGQIFEEEEESEQWRRSSKNVWGY